MEGCKMSQSKPAKYNVIVTDLKDGVGVGTINGVKFTSVMSRYNNKLRWTHFIVGKPVNYGEASVLVRAVNKFSKKQALEAVGV